MIGSRLVPTCASARLCANDCACANLSRTGEANAPDGLICLHEQTCLEEAQLALRAVARRRLPLAGAVHGG